MKKFLIINFLIGSAIAIILSVLLVLGLRIFIPPPEYPPYNSYKNCDYNDPSYADCQQREAENQRVATEKYQKEAEAYGGEIFIAANIVGLLVLLLGIVVFVVGLGTNIAAGIIVAGAFGIIFGYAMGWTGADDKIKFVVGLIVALVVIAGGVIVNKMRNQVLTTSQSA